MAENDVAKELRDIKMLMILQLLSAGVRQRQIASALGISEATMSRLLPKGLGASTKGRSKGEDE